MVLMEVTPVLSPRFLFVGDALQERTSFVTFTEASAGLPRYRSSVHGIGRIHLEPGTLGRCPFDFEFDFHDRYS